jgi:hypothetical protein
MGLSHLELHGVRALLNESARIGYSNLQVSIGRTSWEVSDYVRSRRTSSDRTSKHCHEFHWCCLSSVKPEHELGSTVAYDQNGDSTAKYPLGSRCVVARDYGKNFTLGSQSLNVRLSKSNRILRLFGCTHHGRIQAWHWSAVNRN